MPSFEIVKRIETTDTEYFLQKFSRAIEGSDFALTNFVKEDIRSAKFSATHKKYQDIKGSIHLEKVKDKEQFVCSVKIETENIRTIWYWLIIIATVPFSFGFSLGYAVGDIWRRPSTERIKNETEKAFDRILGNLQEACAGI